MRFSRFLPICGALSVLVFLCGCSLLIPDSPSAPRYNEVSGERHRPMLNNSNAPAAPSAPQSALPAPEPVAQLQPAVQSAPVPVVTAMNNPAPNYTYNASPFPPVDARTRAQAEQVLRQTPSENMDVAGNYPELNAVPPRPDMGPNGANARLNNVRTDLERDRAYSDAERDRLARDAADEPSLLNPLPAGTVPPPAPVQVNPIAPPVVNGAPQPQSFAAPRQQTASVNTPGYIALPPVPAFAPPAPAGGVPPAPFLPQQPMPAPAFMASNAGLEPIMLRPPAAALPVPANAPAYPSSRRAVSLQAMPPRAGGFNPMEGAAAASPATYADATYLPDSRYSARR